MVYSIVLRAIAAIMWFSFVPADVQHNMGGMGRRGVQWSLIDRGLLGQIQLVNAWEVSCQRGFREAILMLTSIC